MVQAQQAVKQYREARVPLSACSVASDGFGSWPVYDKQGRLVSYEVPVPTEHKQSCVLANVVHARSALHQLQKPDNTQKLHCAHKDCSQCVQQSYEISWSTFVRTARSHKLVL